MRNLKAAANRWAVILMVPACLAAAPKAAPPPATARVDVETLVEEGRAALADRRYDEARKSFKDALAVEPKNVVALHGIGLACLNLKDAAPACAYLDRALQQAPADRTITWNDAAAWLQNKNPMRAAKVIMAYLSGPGQSPPDEQMATALGTAISQASDQERSGNFYAELRRFYADYDKKLAAARGNGKARWGTSWIPAKDAEAKWTKLDQRTREAQSAGTELDHTQEAARKASNAVWELRTDMALHGSAEKRSIYKRRDDAMAAEKKAEKKYEQAAYALRNTEQPPFPASVTPTDLPPGAPTMDTQSPPPTRPSTQTP